MNTTVENADFLLEKINSQKAQEVLPATLYVAVAMLIGLIGNSMVCYFYGCKTVRTTNSYLIVVLAVCDLMVCCFVMPGEIIDLSLPYTYHSKPMCVVFTFMDFLSSSSSAFALVLIAGNRYAIVFKPPSQQTSLLQVKMATVVVCVIATAISWPALFVYGINRVNVTAPNNVELVGYDCAFTTEEHLQLYHFILSAVHLVLFMVMTITVSVIYMMIGKKVLQHKNKFGSSASHSTDTSSTAIELEPQGQARQENVDRKNEPISRNATEQILPQDTQKNAKKRSAGSRDVSAAKYTLIMFIITVIFIISFLPYLCLSIWRSTDSRDIDFEKTVVFQIVVRSYLLNSVMNPLVYGLLNSKFRNFFFSCRWRRPYHGTL